MKNNDVAQSWGYGEPNKVQHFFTDGVTIYSYGYHFPIATKAKDGKIYFNKDGYSSTTSNHKGKVARVLGFENVKDLEKNHGDNIVLVDTETLKKMIGV